MSQRTYYLPKQTVNVKHLPKHLQPRWRYLGVAVESWPDTTVERDGFQRALWHSAQHLLGDPGSGALELSVLRCQAGPGWARAVVRTRRGERDRARAVLACVDTVDGDPVGLRAQPVSGTIRDRYENYIGDPRAPRKERDVTFADADPPAGAPGDPAAWQVHNRITPATALATDKLARATTRAGP